MMDSPWRSGPGADGLWIDPADRVRIDRSNSRLPPDDPRRVHYRSPAGAPLVPGAWSGDPGAAPIVLLLLNPAVSPYAGTTYADEEVVGRLGAMARGDFATDYPNAWLHPRIRPIEPWCSTVPLGALHRHLVVSGVHPEEGWQILAKKVAILEMSPWASFRWSPAAIVGTTSFCVSLAAAAAADPSRVVLLGRGESDWKTAGLFDAEDLPLSRGVRSNQSRITSGNFPEAWASILSILNGSKPCKQPRRAVQYDAQQGDSTQ